MSSASAAVAACMMLAVAVCLQCATPVAEAAVSSPARRHDKPVRPRPMAADQPSNQTAAVATADDYDDGNANYDDDYEDNGNYHKKLPVTTTLVDDDSSTDMK